MRPSRDKIARSFPLQKVIALPAGLIWAVHACWQGAEFLHTSEWLLKKAPALAEAGASLFEVLQGLNVQMVPGWVALACGIYFLTWLVLVIFRRPKLIVEYRDDERSVHPLSRDFLIQNRGLDDALDIEMDGFEFDGLSLSVAPIALLKRDDNRATSVESTLSWKDRDVSNQKPLGENLGYALKQLDCLGKDRAEVEEGGFVRRLLIVRYRALMTGARYKQVFLLRFNWALEKFLPVQIL